MNEDLRKLTALVRHRKKNFFSSSPTAFLCLLFIIKKKAVKRGQRTQQLFYKGKHLELNVHCVSPMEKPEQKTQELE